MPPSLQGVALRAYTGIPTGATTGASSNLKAATDAVSTAASNAAEAANSAANTVIERMRVNGWYGVSSSPTTRDSQSDDGYRSPSPVYTPRRSRAANPREEVSSEGESSSTGGEGWKIWQGAYDRVKWQTVGDKVKDAAAAVRKRYGANDGLCESDEEDFEGPGETHLTRVMKEYYIDNSRSAADLPRWLFPDVQDYQMTKAWENAPAAPSYSSSSRSRPRQNESYSRSSADYERGRGERERYESSEERYAERACRSSVPSTNDRDPPLRRSADNASPASAGRLRPSEHGSRTAEKLKRMKGPRIA